MKLTKENGKLAIYLGTGMLSGIVAIWLNYIVFKTRTLFGLSLSYCLVSILIIIGGVYIYKYPKEIQTKDLT